VIGTLHIEPVLVAAYAVLLVIVAAGLEWLAKHSHKRADRYHTGGFRFHHDRDAWECPMGIALIRAEIDHDQQMVLYRAPAHTCNSCQIKSRCTQSVNGREIAVPLDPWVRSASLQLQRGISLVLLTLASFILLLELFRDLHSTDQYVLGGVLVVVLLRFVRLARRTLSRASSQAGQIASVGELSSDLARTRNSFRDRSRA
jgi:hypothetical protein